MIELHSRRVFVRSVAAMAIGVAIASEPREAYSQQPLPRRIGILLVGASPASEQGEAFRKGLRDAGYAEGRDVVIEWRFADGDYDKVTALVAELVHRKVSVIVVDSTNAALAAKRATSTIPTVMALVADPVGSGLVANLAHPGANITGLSVMLTELTAKRLQLLKEAIPHAARVAVLWNPATPWHPRAIEILKVAAASLAIELTFTGVQNREEIGPAFSAARRAHAQALYVIGDAFFLANRNTVLELASSARLPGIYSSRSFADAGALISYGPNLGDVYRRAAAYVDRILKGARPSELPIEQPTKFELVINLKVARALGLTIPESILLQADEVIR